MFKTFRMDRKKKKKCHFLSNGIREIDYKDVELIKKFLSDNGKILPRRLTGTSTKYQRILTRAVKKARHAGLIPYTGDIYAD
ncbi:MAG: 30S ribosomal protein S18 [Candidatus Sericytochromatia bacterium]